MLPTLFWTWNFMMTAASQNSPWIKFITHFVMWDFLNSKPIEQQQIKVSVYTVWIKINHMLKNIFLTLKRYLVSRTFDIMQNWPALLHICGYLRKHLKHYFPCHASLFWLKKIKFGSHSTASDISSHTWERQSYCRMLIPGTNSIPNSIIQYSNRSNYGLVVKAVA